MGVFGNILFVGNENYRIAGFVDVPEQLHYLFRRFRIQVSGRLICQNDGRTIYQGPAHGNALALSAGKLVGFVVHPVCKAHIGQHLFCAFGAVAF